MFSNFSFFWTWVMYDISLQWGHSTFILDNLFIVIDFFCKNTKKIRTFASSFGTMFGNNRECASFLVKIAKSKTKNTRGTEQLIYVGCPAYRACIQVFGDTYKDARWQSTFFLLINIVEILPLSAHGEPCKIRHYEKSISCVYGCLYLQSKYVGTNIGSHYR